MLGAPGSKGDAPVTIGRLKGMLKPLLLAAGLLLGGRDADARPVQDGERIVFLGDSITAGSLYPRYVEAFLRLRHPGWSLSFVNGGIGGHAAVQGLKRLEHDVLRHRPSLVFVNFGMNDAGYQPGASAAAHERHMGTLLDKLQASGARVVWLEPTPVDTRGLAAGAAPVARQLQLQRFVAWTRAEGQRRNIPVVGLHEMLLEALRLEGPTRRKGGLIPDRIHPAPAAHAAMAALVLESLGEDVSPPSLAGRLAEGRLVLSASDRRFESAWDGRTPLTVDLKGLRAPVPLLLKDDAVGGAAGETARRMGRLELRIDGLEPQRRYRLTLGTEPAGRFTGAQLASGVDLMAAASLARRSTDAPADAWCGQRDGNPWVADFFCAVDLSTARDAILLYGRSDRFKPLPEFPPGRRDEAAALLDAWHAAYATQLAQQLSSAAARPHTLRIEPEGPARRR